HCGVVDRVDYAKGNNEWHHAEDCVCREGFGIEQGREAVTRQDREPRPCRRQKAAIRLVSALIDRHERSWEVAVARYRPTLLSGRCLPTNRAGNSCDEFEWNSRRPGDKAGAVQCCRAVRSSCVQRRSWRTRSPASAPTPRSCAIDLR